MSSPYDAERERVAVIAGVASDVYGTGGGAESGFETKYLSPEVLILTTGMHENLYVSTAPSIFLLLGE